MWVGCVHSPTCCSRRRERSAWERCCCCCCWRPLHACRKCRAATSWERGGGSWGSCSSSRARHCHGAASPAAMHPHCIPVVPASLHRCIPIASQWCLHPLQQHIPIASPRRLHPCTNTFQWCQHPRTNASPLHLYGACIPAPTHPHGASMPPQMHPHCILVVPASLHQRIPCSNAPPSHPTHQCIPAAILHRCSTAPKRAADPPSSPPLPSSSSSRWGQRDAGSRSCARRVGWEVLASGNACVPGGGRKHLAEQRG